MFKPVKCGLVAMAVLSALTVRAESLPGGSVAALLELARQQSPEVIALRLEADAARERAAASGALPDPTARIEWRDFTNDMAGGGANLLPARVGSTKYTLIQPLPWWGKRDLKREVARAEAEAVQASSDAGWLELAARIKTAYALDHALSRQLALSRELGGLLDQLEAIGRNRYAHGLAPQQDAIRARVERTALQSEIVQTETERHHAQVRINGLLARPAHAALAEPRTPRAMPTSLDHAALAERLRTTNPGLFADDARIRAAEKNRDATYRNRYPDLALGISPIQTRNRISEWELMLELNIPLQQSSRRSQEREAERMLEAARARREVSANRLLTELAENVAAFEAARRIERLTRDEWLPQAELTFQAALAGYENGKVDFATLLDAQRQIRKARQDAIKAQAEQQMRLAEIERLVGEDL
ncbi:MAG: TolC family protein [Rhodocyclaceae bacterium]|jgi:cobalt-zinc-cadmium efflux system outer membrane protein|nr:TolC family protein [Rhodocyclaceae bacterium]MBK6555133.1 TolC family protein [Rhodocyclaceae bacterium]MBK6676914.1 TolC family protein [Rhodocyclaceae bacterium]MBK9309585.1 TolC family protein [Rhodocyclaceae bacterium]MBK9955326.1 TolC family protein [Rhodocyclaceae bacterium]